MDNKRASVKPTGTFVETFPLKLAGFGVGIHNRIGQTKTAMARGRDLAAAAKPMMYEQSELIIEAEDIAGNARCSAILNAIEDRTETLRQKVSAMREAAVITANS